MAVKDGPTSEETRGQGKILLSLTGMHPQRWYELLTAERAVVTEPDGSNDPEFKQQVLTWY